ncbi:unnamed protein product [Cyprideis torosa]|uniref:Uncharacterized protein n=1 Tax=Cyprideis torosa TaxID=163714 RepID=A0A7R8W9Z9_9CRUS|nr:unnamed protein product [Cyprideis torosa]CAG0885874.1 unnamed protein product [Cyprideis torosa]
MSSPSPSHPAETAMQDSPEERSRRAEPDGSSEPETKDDASSDLVTPTPSSGEVFSYENVTPTPMTTEVDSSQVFSAELSPDPVSPGTLPRDSVTTEDSETSPTAVALREALDSLSQLTLLSRPKINPFKPISLTPFNSPSMDDIPPHYRRHLFGQKSPQPIRSKKTGKPLPRPRPVSIPSLPAAAGEWLKSPSTPESEEPRYTSSPHPDTISGSDLQDSASSLCASSFSTSTPTSLAPPAAFAPSPLVPLPLDPVTPSRSAYNPGKTVPKYRGRSFTDEAPPAKPSPASSLAVAASPASSLVVASKSSQTSVKDIVFEVVPPPCSSEETVVQKPPERPTQLSFTSGTPVPTSTSPTKYSKRPYLTPPPESLLGLPLPAPPRLPTPATTHAPTLSELAPPTTNGLPRPLLPSTNKNVPRSRISWSSPETSQTQLSTPGSRTSWAGGVPHRLHAPETSLDDFKRLLSSAKQKQSPPERKLSAVEALKVKKPPPSHFPVGLESQDRGGNINGTLPLVHTHRPHVTRVNLRTRLASPKVQQLLNSTIPEEGEDTRSRPNSVIYANGNQYCTMVRAGGANDWYGQGLKSLLIHLPSDNDSCINNNVEKFDRTNNNSVAASPAPLETSL